MEKNEEKRRKRGVKKKLLNTTISVPSMLMQMVHKFVKLHRKSMRRGRTSSSVRRRGSFNKNSLPFLSTCAALSDIKTQTRTRR